MAEEQRGYLSVLKDPRVIMKIIELFLAILMFATTAAYADELFFTITCSSTSASVNRKLHITYPFELDKIRILGACTLGEYFLVGDASAAAMFFIGVGALAFIYIIFITVCYVCMGQNLHWDVMLKADFIIHCVYTLSFFISSCIWAVGVNMVKDETDFDNIQKDVLPVECLTAGNTCKLMDPLSFASLNASLFFGFVNAIVWGGNCVLVYTGISLPCNLHACNKCYKPPANN